jgi:type I restriction enzyme S subunit
MKFPHNWPVARLGDVVADMQPGFAQAPGEGDSGTGQIRTHNVTPDGELSLAELKYVSPSEKEAEKYLLKKDDIVFNNTNSEEWVGKTALFNIDEPLLFSNHMTRIRVNTKLVLPEFIARYLHFLWKVGFSKTRAKRWVSQAAVDQRELSAYKVPLPSLPEQQRIIEILKQADGLRHQRREILEQTIRAKEIAFYEIIGIPEQTMPGKNQYPLEKLADINPSLNLSAPLDEDTKVSFIPMSAIDESTGRITACEKKRYAEVSKGYTAFKDGDVLFAKITPCMENGKAAIARGLLNGVGFGSTEYHVLRPKEGVTSEYLLGLVRRTEFRELAKRFFVGTSGHQRVADAFMRRHQVAKPDKLAQRKYLEGMAILDQLADEHQCQLTLTEDLCRTVTAKAFSGELTREWREVHRTELEMWLREHAEQLPKKSTRISFKEIVPPVRATPSRPARHWVMEQLSAVQQQVYRALGEWNGTLIPAEDLVRFLEEWAVEHLEDAHDQVLRALNQLAGLGLIARVSVPNREGDYVSSYRVLRDDELSKFDDERRLGVRA